MMIDRLADYHIHSTYNDHSDSDLTIKNVIDIAGKLGLKKIAFTNTLEEHPTGLKDI
jgi:putative hydrolase